MPKLAQILKRASGLRQVCVSVFFFSDHCIKQIDSMLPWVCSVIDHRRRQNVVKTTVTHSPAARVPLLCFYDILTSSVIYYWTDTRQHRIYLLNKRSPGFFDWQFLCLARLLVSLGSLSTNRKYPHSQKASWNDFHGPLGQKLLLPSRVSLTHPILPSVFLPPITSKGLLYRLQW